MKMIFRKNWVPLFAFLLWSLALYVLILHHFAFFSDDFGYFLNFRRQLGDRPEISAILASYLTGGVPRLQVAWHIVHQILFYFFGTSIYAYFLIEVLVLFSSAVLFYFFLLPVFGMVPATLGGLVLLTSPFFQETFYWVSANYGFFQVFFLLAALLCFRRSLRSERVPWVSIVFSALLLGISVLFMEQAMPMLFLAPLSAYFFYSNLVNEKVLRNRCALWCGTTLLLLVALFLPQLFIIKTGSSTSLLDTFKMYYPTPWQSFTQNFWPAFRQSFFGGVSKFQYSSFFVNNWKANDPSYRMIWLLQVVLFALLSFATYKYFRKGGGDQESSMPRNFRLLLGAATWFAGASVVVLPIQYFTSRYVFFHVAAGNRLVSVRL